MVFIIGVTGGSASGKSKFAIQLKDHLTITHKQTVEIIHMDDFYKGLSIFSDEELVLFRKNKLNLDSPDMIDLKSLEKVLSECSSDAKIPIYHRMSYDTTGYRTLDLSKIDIIIVEGIFIFNNVNIYKKCSLTIYVDTPNDIRLKRRLNRYDEQQHEKQTEYYNRFVVPAFNNYTLSFKKKCTCVVNGTVSFDGNIVLISDLLEDNINKN
jgi:uridine kinase